MFIGNVVSAGVGITLTKGDITIFNSFSWIPGINDQCEDRSYRIGRKNNVTIYYQLFLNTVSLRMWNTLTKKKEVINKILKDRNLKEEDIIEKLLEI